MITTTVETINKDTADQYLAASIGNRQLKRGKVEAYVRDMNNGKWDLNGEAIIFDSEGSLVDGHHRLTAISKSGTTAQFVVVRGVSPDARKTVDTGAPRNASDVLAIHGVKASTTVYSVVRAYMSLELGRAGGARPSTHEVFEFIEKHPDVYEAAEFAKEHNHVSCAAVFGALYLVGTEKGFADVVRRFANVFQTGIPAYSGCPAHYVRERILLANTKGQKMPRVLRHMMIVEAFNRFIQEVPVKQIRKPSRFRLEALA